MSPSTALSPRARQRHITRDVHLSYHSPRRNPDSVTLGREEDTGLAVHEWRWAWSLYMIILGAGGVPQ